MRLVQIHIKISQGEDTQICCYQFEETEFHRLKQDFDSYLETGNPAGGNYLCHKSSRVDQNWPPDKQNTCLMVEFNRVLQMEFDIGNIAAAQNQQ